MARSRLGKAEARDAERQEGLPKGAALDPAGRVLIAVPGLRGGVGLVGISVTTA